jgi:hypothetical protein
MSDVIPQLPNAPRVSIGISSVQGNQYPAQPQRVFDNGYIPLHPTLHFCNIMGRVSGILGLCVFAGYDKLAPADIVTELVGSSNIANRFFLSLCRT